MSAERHPCSGKMSRRHPRPGTPCPVRTSHASGICSLHRSQRLVKRGREITRAAEAFVETYLQRPARDAHAPTATEARLVDAFRCYQAERDGMPEPLPWISSSCVGRAVVTLEMRIPHGHERDELHRYAEALLSPLGSVSVNEVLATRDLRGLRLEVTADVLLGLVRVEHLKPPQKKEKAARHGEQ